MLGILERFGGYTLATLLEEDAGLLRLISVEYLGKPPPEEPDYG